MLHLETLMVLARLVKRNIIYNILRKLYKLRLITNGLKVLVLQAILSNYGLVFISAIICC